MSSITSGSIAARPPGSQHTKKQRDGFALILEGVLDNPAPRAPRPYNADLPEQRFPNGQDVEAVHVLVHVFAFDMDAILVRDHAHRIAQTESGVQ